MIEIEAINGIPIEEACQPQLPSHIEYQKDRVDARMKTKHLKPWVKEAGEISCLILLLATMITMLYMV